MDLVKSGIEEGFETAFSETIKTSEEMGVNWRRAAYINSLTKLHEHYEQVGITFSKWKLRMHAKLRANSFLYVFYISIIDLCKENNFINTSSGHCSTGFFCYFVVIVSRTDLKNCNW